MADIAKYVGPTVKSDRNVIGPIKPTSFSDQMSAIVCMYVCRNILLLRSTLPDPQGDWTGTNELSGANFFELTNVRSRFPRFSFEASFPVKVKLSEIL